MRLLCSLLIYLKISRMHCITGQREYIILVLKMWTTYLSIHQCLMCAKLLELMFALYGLTLYRRLILNDMTSLFKHLHFIPP
jgi:hypothetical protein